MCVKRLGGHSDASDDDSRILPSENAGTARAKGKKNKKQNMLDQICCSFG
jgi:hypothetical protein